jgi:hypothetical protein
MVPRHLVYTCVRTQVLQTKKTKGQTYSMALRAGEQCLALAVSDASRWLAVVYSSQ